MSTALRRGVVAALLVTAPLSARSAYLFATLDWSGASYRVESLSGVGPAPTLSWIPAPTVAGGTPAFSASVYTAICCSPYGYQGIDVDSGGTSAAAAVSEPAYGGSGTADPGGLSASAYVRGPGSPSRQAFVIASGSRWFQLSDPGTVTFALPFSALAVAPEAGDTASAILYATVYGADGTALDEQYTGYAASAAGGPQGSPGGYADLVSLTYTGLQPLSQGRLEGILQVDVHSSSAVSPVPEPSAWGMMLAGLALSAWAARRRSGTRD